MNVRGHKYVRLSNLLDGDRGKTDDVEFGELKGNLNWMTDVERVNLRWENRVQN